MMTEASKNGITINALNKNVMKFDIDNNAFNFALARSSFGEFEVVDGQVKKVENPVLRYDVTSVRPFDMFANTKHIETLVVLTKSH